MRLSYVWKLVNAAFDEETLEPLDASIGQCAQMSLRGSRYKMRVGGH